MGNNRYHRFRDILLVSFGLAFLAYIIARILNVSLSCDENGSYFMFVQKGEIFPTAYDVYSANNHALNTAMMMWCEKLFGTTVFAIRLPNLIGAALYLFSTAMMCRRIRPPFIGVLAYLVLNTNPYMIQYFGVARGYGIAAGFMSFAFWQLWLYFDNGYKMCNLIPAIIAGTLAVFANYSYFNLFLPVAGFTGIIALWRPGASISSMRARIIPAAFIAVIVLGSLAVIIPIAQSIKEAGGFWPSGLTTFWSGSIMTIVHCMLNDVTHDATTVDRIIIIIGELYFVAALAAIVWTIVKWKDGERPLFPIFIFTVLTLSGLSVMVQFWLMGTEIVIQRMGLFMLWPFMILISLAAGFPGRFNVFVHVPFTILTSVLVWHFFATASLDREVYRPYSEDVNIAIDEIRKANTGKDRVHLGLDHLILAHGFRFYQVSMPLSDFDVVVDSLKFHPLNDFCFVTKDFEEEVPVNWKVMKTYGNGNVLYHNNAPITEIVYRKLLHKGSDSTVVIDSTNKAWVFGDRLEDTIGSVGGMLIHIRYEMKRGYFTRGSNYVSVQRDGKEIYVRRIDMQEFPGTGDWVIVEKDIIIPQLKPSDDIVIPCFWDFGGPIEIRNYSVTLEGYN